MTWLTTLGSALFSQCDRLIVGSILDTRILGIYAAITSITAQINTFSSLPIQPLLPRLSQLIAKQNSEPSQLKEQVKQALLVNGIVALGLGGTLLTLAPFIIKIIIPTGANNEYLFAFRLATIIYSLYSMNGVGYYILFSINAVNISLIIQLFSGGFSLLFIGFASYFFGLTGAIIGNAGYLIVWLLNIRAMRKLNIPSIVWIKWIKFLLVWFLIVSIISLVFPIPSFYLNIFVLILQTAILLIQSMQRTSIYRAILQRI
jgi:O-antigen/teichoic acid export membrane protein